MKPAIPISLIAMFCGGVCSAQQSISLPQDFGESIYCAQPTASTCWAACNVMLLRAASIRNKIDNLVSDNDNDAVAMQVKRMKVVMPDGGMNGAGPSFDNARVAIQGPPPQGAPYPNGTRVSMLEFDRRHPNKSNPNLNSIFVNILKGGNPCIVASPMHGMVAVGVKYTQHGNQTAIHQIEVLDPIAHAWNWPKRRWLSPHESQQLFGFMAVRKVAKSAH